MSHLQKLMLLATVVQVLAVMVVSSSHQPNLIPPDKSQLETWVSHNYIKPHLYHNYSKTKENITHLKFDSDRQLVAVEHAFKIIKVRKDGTGDFKTVTDAVNSIPSGNKRRFIVWIGGGEYREKITVDKSKPFLTFYGDKDDMPSITFNGTASEYGTVNSATVAVESDYFVAVNIAFVNSSPMPDGKREGAQAVAMRISGDKAAFHKCKFIGFQDTLCDDKGRHFFNNCYIQGTVDFIFGNGKSLYLNTKIHTVAKGVGVITAQARENVSDDSGFAFIHCNVTGTGNANTYLGRAWKGSPRVVFAYTYMGTLINTLGWSNAMRLQHDTSVYYGEYKCKGPGASTSGRVKYAKILTDEQVKPFMTMNYINGNKWLLRPPLL